MKKRKDFFNKFLNNLPYKSITAVVLVLLLVLPLLQVPLFSPNAATVQAATGDFSIDFVAAAPHTYNHDTGGGAYDDGTTNVDVVESLEGGDFACYDIVTYFVAVAVDNTQSAIDDEPQTIEMDFSFLMDSTGQPGVAIDNIVYSSGQNMVNYGTIAQWDVDGDGNLDVIGDGPGETDAGIINDDGGSVATLTDEQQIGVIFEQGSVLKGTVQLTDLEADEQVVVRIDVELDCKLGENPTGNLQAALDEVRLTHVKGVALDEPETIPSGDQTIPFKVVSQILFPELNMFKSVSLDGTCPGEETLSVPVGTTVYYCYEVNNAGNTDLYNFTVEDDKLGYLFTDLDYLASGTSVNNYSNPLWHEANADITNIATATGYTEQGEPISDSASCTVTVYEADFGDLPVDYHLTSLLDDGARHELSGLFLGETIDAETYNEELYDASGDGADDDGILLPLGSNWSDGLGELTAIVSSTVPAEGNVGCLTGWLDFTDGSVFEPNNAFTDTYQTYGELIIDNQPVAIGSNDFNFALPPGAADGAVFYGRFRLVAASQGECPTIGPGLTGYWPNGEVEDYIFIFGPTAVTLTDFASSSNGGVHAGLLIAAGLLGVALIAFYILRSRRIHLNG